MCVVTWLPTFRPGVPSTRSWYSVKAIGATINLDGIGMGDITGDITDKVAGKMDMILY